MFEKVCQSCGMPLTDDKLLGTEKGGAASKEYCVYCYEDGRFLQPDLTMEAMIEICVPHMKEGGMKEEEARALLNSHLPKLKRWSAR
ncbi:Putative zinc ribbon domain-containing protein [Desulfotomaculum arcticum]|uniref:Putative zinc ribbon domain-containing protein n=1 Tax=Desulfotruncus arcticus DSM 17038 TaxID=1121424 RepID=A0A1I2VUQ7_9FIRM|nr:zinc ribbon domain-containing protein [Desulfotruncus arcticus]SFG92882.1 Putative zinc ribbon domain-containing protein [Desulfotomaculum arcticum] [Desulfotruncus arcticus DSM 17038]